MVVVVLGYTRVGPETNQLFEFLYDDVLTAVRR